ncbi:MAG: ABC transporter permease [Ruminococcaceae bacterium]|nr:ABC transporter permease [Oscillospiraceae bacterium]
MRKYILKRILLSIVILFFVGFIIYALMRCLPTSYLESVARQKSMTPGSKSFEEWMEQLKATYNMDSNIIPGYFKWIGNMFKGEFGDSWKWTVPVMDKFHDTVWLSFVMGAISFFFQIIIAIPLGVIAATKQYSKTDYAVSIFALAGISLPTFFFASLLKLVFSVKLGWFDLFGLVGRNHELLSASGQLLDKAHHLVLPIVTLVVISVGSLMRYTRTNMLEVLSSDYIRTARAKGLSERKVIYHHAFRNTLIPLVTIIGGSLPGLFSGALITETLYSIPGIGYASYHSMVSGDIPFSMFYLVFLAVLTLAGNLISDILYAVVDPRVRIA